MKSLVILGFFQSNLNASVYLAVTGKHNTYLKTCLLSDTSTIAGPAVLLCSIEHTGIFTALKQPSADQKRLFYYFF